MVAELSLALNAGTRRYDAVVIVAGGIACVVVLVALLVAPGGSLVTAAVHDAFIWFELAHRIDSGQIPYTDFHSPLGVIALTLPFVGYRLSGSFAGTMPAAFALYLVVFTPCALFVLASRLRSEVALPLFVFLALLIVVPIVPGAPPTKVNLGLWYNRFGWATFSALLLLYLPTLRPLRHQAWFDAAAAAFLTLVLFYLKISFAACAVAALVLIAVLKPDMRGAFWRCLVLTLAAALAIELCWRIHASYFADLVFLFKTTPPLRGGAIKLLSAPLKYVFEIAIPAAALGLAWWLRALRWNDVVFFLFAVACSLALINQNTGDGALPALIVPIVLAWARLNAGLNDGTTARSGEYLALARTSVLALLLAFVIQPITYRAIALGLQVWGTTKHDAQALPVPLPRLAGFVVKDSFGLRFRASDPMILERLQEGPLTPARAFVLLRDRQGLDAQEMLSNAEYLLTIAKGIEALQQVQGTGREIFTFDTVNPFPFLLDSPPVSGDLFNYDIDRQFSLSNYVKAEHFLPSVDIAMVPTFPMTYQNRDALLRIYGDDLRTHYSITLVTPYWTVWKRADATQWSADERAHARPAHTNG